MTQPNGTAIGVISKLFLQRKNDQQEKDLVFTLSLCYVLHSSTLWDNVTDQEKRKFKFRRSHDGEFWMSYEDFITNFNDLQICHRGPKSLGPLETVSSTTNLSQVKNQKRHTYVIHSI
jgi:hypothetical protein